jgi:hypothetical protein
LRLTKPILTAIALVCAQFSFAQKKLPVNRWFDSISITIKKIQELGKRDSFEIVNKSELSTRIADQLKVDTPAFLTKKPAVPHLSKNLSLPKKAMFDFKGGFVSYNWNFRSNIDTPFQEKNLSQHFFTTNLNFTIAQNIPIIVSYYDRESNSKYFRDYRDFRIEFNTQEFNRLQAQKLSAYTEQLIGQFQNPLTKPSLNYATKELDKIENWKNQRSTQNKLIRSKVIVLSGGTFDTLTNSIDTTTLSKAKAFIALYDEIIKQTGKLGQYRDSLQKEYVSSEKEIAFVKKIVSGNQSGPDKKEVLSNALAKHGIEDKRLERLYSAASSIKTLAIGRTAPNYSELTLKNINVKGINFEYSRGIYFALSAGTIDYRARDFFYSKAKRKPQFIYAARLGYGQRERTHFYFTAFKGRKQVLSSIETPAIDIYGLSFESQVAINKNNRLAGEIAQSASPPFINSSGTSKSTFNIKDEKNRAYSIKLNSYFPRSRSRLEAFYKYRGINYQNFTSYYTNAALSQWSVKADQYLLKRLLHINASVAKNTYENPYLLTRYNGNTVFKNLSATFRKAKLPSVTIGYMPSSQLSDINGQIYENFYQALNLSINHQYKIGIAKAVSLFSFNQFYNSSNDTGFLYYNAKNYFFSQHFDFLSYTTDVNIARTNSRDYVLTVLDAGIGARIKKQSTIGFGVKINQLNNRSLKVGLYGSEKISIPKLGELSAWIEKCYLPGWKQELVKTEFYNIGFFRVIN